MSFLEEPVRLSRPKRLTTLHRYYFALRPPPSLAQAISGLALDLAQHHDGAAPYSPDRLHISLCGFPPLVTASAALQATAIKAGDAIEVPPFPVVFDRVMSWGRVPPWTVVLRCSMGAAEIARLHRAIAAASCRAGLDTEHKPGVPHLTLWRTTRPLPERALAKPFCWTVDDFWLIHGIGGTGKHEWPGHWRLSGTPSEPPPDPEPLLL
jgi:2'-5' RNA ligase